MAFTTGLNNYNTTKWLVNSTAGLGTHTTIASALTSASSGDDIYIMPGTYTENPTLKAGVNLIAYNTDSASGQVIILGKCGASFSGTCNITGIQLKTNSDFCLSLTGANATIVNLYNCLIDANNNTAINSSGSNAAATVNLYQCNGALDTTGIAYWSFTNGVLYVNSTILNNGGSSTTANTFSGASLNIKNSFISNPVTTSGSNATLFSTNNYYSLSNINTTAINSNSTVANSTFIINDYIVTGSAVPVTVGASSTLNCSLCTFNSTNSSAVTGSGTFLYSHLSQISTIGTLSATTITSKGTIGNQTNSATAAGYIGETLVTQQTGNVVMSINTITNIATFTPSKGQWEISGIVNVTYNTGVSIANTQGCLATTNSNFTGIDGFTYSLGVNTLPYSGASSLSSGNIVLLGPCKVLADGATTYYLNAFLSGTSASTIRGNGSITGKRIA